MLAQTPQVLVIEAVTILNARVYIVISELVERVNQIASSIANIKAISQSSLVLFQQSSS